MMPGAFRLGANSGGDPLNISKHKQLVLHDLAPEWATRFKRIANDDLAGPWSCPA